MLWRQLRAAVKVGNTDEANKAAMSLGFIDSGERRRLLDRVHKQEVRRG